MARRYDHSREELYTMAMTAAADMVARDGVRALTTRKLAAEIGYSPGTLYNIFSNLDDLIVQVNGTTLDKLHDEIAAVPVQDDVAASLQEMANRYIDFTMGNYDLWNALFEHRLPQGQVLPDWYNEKIGKLLSLVEQHLAPVFPNADDPDRATAARVLWASLHGICSLAAADKLDIVATESARQLTASLINNYLTGLKGQD